MDRCIYLHGFASGPSSYKARYLGPLIENLGLKVEVPDLNGASFTRMTLTSQLTIVREYLDDIPAGSEVLIIGSSMGGLLATLMAQMHEKVSGLVLMAPGFGISARFRELVGSNGLKNWRAAGHVEVFHHAYNRDVPLAYEFVNDAEGYRTDRIEVKVPTVVLHGRNDQTVPLSESIAFQKANPGLVELHVLEDDHQLINSLAVIWSRIVEFIDRRQDVEKS